MKERMKNKPLPVYPSPDCFLDLDKFIGPNLHDIRGIKNAHSLLAAMEVVDDPGRRAPHFSINLCHLTRNG